jgi:hypothetical protein
LFSALAIAELRSFTNSSLDAFGANLATVNASSTFLPLIKSATILTFLAEILA